MQNTFSRSFKIDGAEDKKFYFKPDRSTDASAYTVHINGSVEMKKFKMKKEQDNTWKIEKQDQKLPDWLYTLESAFNTEIEQSISLRKPASLKR
jgi:hypothetical protein